METILRYNNRKLYSTMGNSYVTLDYIMDLVRTNSKFQVLDHGSKEDITKKTLKAAISRLDLPQDKLVSLIKGEN